MTILDEGRYSASLLAVASVPHLLYFSCSIITLLRSYVVSVLHSFVLTFMSYSPHFVSVNWGHEANGIRLASLNQGLVPRIVQAGAQGRCWLFLPMGIVKSVSAGATEFPFFVCSIALVCCSCIVT